MCTSTHHLCAYVTAGKPQQAYPVVTCWTESPQRAHGPQSYIQTLGATVEAWMQAMEEEKSVGPGDQDSGGQHRWLENERMS